MTRETTCCFTGHRPEKMPFPVDRYTSAFFDFTDRLREAIESAIKLGYVDFITGMSRGVDLWSAEILLDLKNTYPQIKLNAAIPYTGLCSAWCEGDKQLYNDILKRCATAEVLYDRFRPGCMQARNRYMVDHSSLVIAVLVPGTAGGTEYTCRYAHNKGVDVRYVQAVKEDI